MDWPYQAAPEAHFMTVRVTRRLTISLDGDLIDLANEERVDYAPISNESTIQKISDAYGRVVGDYSNEIFINIVVKKLEWQGLISNADDLELATHKGIDANIWNEIVRSIKGGNLSLILYLKDWFLSSLLFSISLVALPIKCIASLLLAGRCKNDLSTFSIIRSDASYDKIRAVSHELGIVMLSEDIVYRNIKLGSVFSYVQKFNFIKGIPALVLQAISDYMELRKELERFVSYRCAQRFMLYYSPRIVAKCCFERLLINILEKNSTDMVTGNKEDRYAMVEKRVVKKFNRKLTCIPHGLEYSYKFPAGLAGDVFFCTSQKSLEVLSSLYKTNVFVLDSAFNKKIYSRRGPSKEYKSIERVVFFTEPRDIDVNRQILDCLNHSAVPFRVKLHPNDNSGNYDGYDLTFVDSLPDALTYPISIARKSTILLNAAYLGNMAVAVLIDSKDLFYATYVFPSLSDVRIINITNQHDFKFTLNGLNSNV